MKTAIVGASVLALLSLAPLQLGANAKGLLGHHFSGHPHGGHHGAHGAYGGYGAYGDYGAAPFYGDAAVLDSDMSGTVISSAPPAQIVYVPEAPQVLSCHHSEQVVTVPAEDGGTRQVTVTRC